MAGLTIALRGEVDQFTGPLDPYVEQFARTGACDVVVDLTNVTFFGCSGLGFLGRLAGVAQDRGGAVTVVGASRIVERCIRAMGMDRILQLS